MKATIEAALGIRPKIAPQLLNGNEAQIAKNCTLSSGHIKPWFNYAQVGTLTDTGLVRTIYNFESNFWFEWEADVDVVESPASENTEGRFYYTGDGIPKKSNHVEATTGAGAMPINFYPMAVPTPFPVPILSLGSGGTGVQRAINYIWTIVTTWSEEGLPSLASETLEALQGQAVTLSGMTMEWSDGKAYTTGNFVFAVGDEGGIYLYKCVSAGVSGGTEPTWNQTLDQDTIDNSVTWRCYKNNLLEKRIYRINTGDQSASYQYVDRIGINETTYIDTKADDSLDESIVSEDYDPPIDTLIGLTYMGHGIVAGFSGKDLYFSEPYKPWAYPIAYSLSIPDSIVAIASVNGTLCVLTEDKPYVIAGIDPSAVISTPLPISMPCVSKRSLAVHEKGAYYASPNGIAAIDGVQSALITKNQFDRLSWKAYYPDTMHSYIHDNDIFMFYSYNNEKGAIIYDLLTGQVTSLEMYTDAAYVDEETDTLYFQKLVDSINYIYEWEADTTQPFPINYLWRSKKILLGAKANFQVARVISELGDRAAYQQLLDDHAAAISRNIARISAGQIGGSIGEDTLGGNISINGDNLEPVEDVPAYSGAFGLTFRVYANNVKETDKEIYSDRPFKINSGYRKREFYFEVEGNLEIKRIDLANSMREITS